MIVVRGGDDKNVLVIALLDGSQELVAPLYLRQALLRNPKRQVDDLALPYVDGPDRNPFARGTRVVQQTFRGQQGENFFKDIAHVPPGAYAPGSPLEAPGSPLDAPGSPVTVSSRSRRFSIRRMQCLMVAGPCC